MKTLMVSWLGGDFLNQLRLAFSMPSEGYELLFSGVHIYVFKPIILTHFNYKPEPMIL